MSFFLCPSRSLSCSLSSLSLSMSFFLCPSCSLSCSLSFYLYPLLIKYSALRYKNSGSHSSGPNPVIEPPSQSVPADRHRPACHAFDDVDHRQLKSSSKCRFPFVTDTSSRMFGSGKDQQHKRNILVEADIRSCRYLIKN